MNSNQRASILTVIFLGMIVVSCTHLASESTKNRMAFSDSSTADRHTPTQMPDKVSASSSTPSPTVATMHTATPSRIGPEYIIGHNPLTGEQVSDTDSLNSGPVLISVTNFPPSARPQAGLSAASHVWEISLGQGDTRFLAVYYGDYKEILRNLNRQRIDDTRLDTGETYVIGPVRSGRVPYEEIKLLYPNGKLFIRYASPKVLQQLTSYETVYASDPTNINSAGIYIDDLDGLTERTVDPMDLSGLIFDSSPMQEGEAAEDFKIIFNYYNHVGWTYDRESGGYLRSQDRSDGEGNLNPAVDRLNGEQLEFENVLILFAKHHFENFVGTILEIDIQYLPSAVGYLFRDGRMTEIRWSTRGANLEILDVDGNPMPLKHGKTFFEVLSYQSTWNAVERVFRYHSPPPKPTYTPTVTPTLTETPTETPTPSPEPP